MHYINLTSQLASAQKDTNVHVNLLVFTNSGLKGKLWMCAFLKSILIHRQLKHREFRTFHYNHLLFMVLYISCILVLHILHFIFH